MFFIFVILILIIIIILNSKLQIIVKNLDISTARIEKINEDYEIYLEIIIFNKIEIFKFNTKKLKNKKVDLKKVLDKAKQIEQKDNNSQLAIYAVKSLKYLQLQVISADLEISLGTENAAITAILLGIISSVLGISLKHHKFKIIPIYKDKNILNIKLNCIIRLNLIHYIYKTILKGRDKNERKSSYRRPYAYSNE